MGGIMLLFLALMMIPAYIIIMFIPYVTRRTESFGISIPEEMYDRIDLKRMRKQYAMIMGIISVLFTIAFLLLSLLFGKDESTTSILFSILITFYLLGSFLVYLNFHRQMKYLQTSS